MDSNILGTTIDNLRNLQMPQQREQQKEHREQQKEQQKEQYVEDFSQKHDFDIEELTRDINENIPDETFLSVIESEEDNSTYIPFGWKEPLLLLIIYLLLSQAIVRQTVGKYIPQLNPSADGTVSFVGVLIYGILLVTVYFILKKILI